MVNPHFFAPHKSSAFRLREQSSGFVVLSLVNFVFKFQSFIMNFEGIAWRLLKARSDLRKTHAFTQ